MFLPSVLDALLLDELNSEFRMAAVPVDPRAAFWTFQKCGKNQFYLADIIRLLMGIESDVEKMYCRDPGG